MENISHILSTIFLSVLALWNIQQMCQRSVCPSWCYWILRIRCFACFAAIYLSGFALLNSENRIFPMFCQRSICLGLHCWTLRIGYPYAFSRTSSPTGLVVSVCWPRKWPSVSILVGILWTTSTSEGQVNTWTRLSVATVQQTNQCSKHNSVGFYWKL